MMFQSLVVIIVLLMVNIEALNDDRFNFGETVPNPSGSGHDYGPADWAQVTCDTLGTCLGFPDTWQGASLVLDWSPDTNICQSCPETGNSCGLHWQSPINLKRDKGIPGNINEKICPDWHHMKYEPGACTWDDLINNQNGAVHANNFFIQRHALQITSPLTANGDLACFNSLGRQYPRLDYSKGFPDWWHLAHTEIIVPSVHTQEGKRYDAEVHLSHFYEVDDIDKNKLGKVAIFLEAFDGAPHLDFLDKLICQWRESEDQTRSECGLASVPDYVGCRNPIRGRTASPTTLQPVTLTPVVSTTAPLPVSTATPTSTPMAQTTTEFVCNPAINYKSICSSGCCDSTASTLDLCTIFTSFIGADFQSACSNCCAESPRVTDSTSQVTQDPIYLPIDCSRATNPGRICSSFGCCEATRSTTSFCEGMYNTFPGDEIGSLCWHCCPEPKQVGPARARSLRAGDSKQSILQESTRQVSVNEVPSILLHQDNEHEEVRKMDLFVNAENADERATRLKVDDSNREAIVDDERTLLESVRKFRELESLTESEKSQRHLLNYDHVTYNPYEWLVAVKTEYYFRYEGSFTTPPCSQIIHWRVMKDPIQVNPDQIKELERLLAWRTAPKGSLFNECQVDTSGKERPGRNGDAVDLNRPIQSTTSIHRIVFCECKDYKSVFEEDQRWCRREINTRMYDVPYGYGRANETSPF